MAYPSQYYVIPEHHIRLSDDRTELLFEQHLPDVRKNDLKVEVLVESICLDFRPEGKERVSRCYSLPYQVVPSEASGDFTDGRLFVRARLRHPPGVGKTLDLQ